MRSTFVLRGAMRLFVADCGLTSCQACHGDTEGGTADVVVAHAVAEVDGYGVSTVFTTDADFEVWFADLNLLRCGVERDLREGRRDIERILLRYVRGRGRFV